MAITCLHLSCITRHIPNSSQSQSGTSWVLYTHSPWNCKWLLNASLEWQKCSQWGQRKCAGSAGMATAAVFILQLPLIKPVCHFSSKLSYACFVRARQLMQSCAHCSYCLGIIPAYVICTFTQSLKLLWDLPWFLLPRESSPDSSCFGIPESSICMTCPVHQRLAFRIMASILVVSALLRTSRFVILSCHSMLRIDLRLCVRKHFSSFKCFPYNVQVLHSYKRLVRMMALYTLSFVNCQMLCWFNTCNCRCQGPGLFCKSSHWFLCPGNHHWRPHF